MAKIKTPFKFMLVPAAFIIYTFIAAGPIPPETVMSPQWFVSLETAEAGDTGEAELIPFELGDRFGYLDAAGRFSINRLRTGYLSLSASYWAEYTALPEVLELRDPRDRSVISIEGGRGYPLFLEDQIFLISEDQIRLSALDEGGDLRWAYTFASPLTDIDAAGGLVLAGCLDGTVELLDAQGRRIFFFEPGGSRLQVILACRISRDGSKLAVISGIDDQRFLYLERSGDSYKVGYHEFLADGFRRPVYLAFINGDRSIAFERQGGIGVYSTETRTSRYIPLEGAVAALEGDGRDGLLYVITAPSPETKRLAAIRLPGTVIMEAPFRTESVFLGRQGEELFIGGESSIASFRLERR
ncbi:MAG: WD40 repeat domain-containing protein [Treponema sp.]|jgi:hypothetical protein|nr:WD40 repeat domain-containing protein [Treponema sp.]